MFAKPERISVFIYLISILFLVISAVSLTSLDLHFHASIIPIAFAFFFLCYTAEMLNQKLKYFVALLPFHTAAVFIVIASIGFQYPLIDVMIVSSLVMNIALRLPAKFSIPLNIFAVGLPLTIAAAKKISLLDVIVPISIELVLVLFCQVVIFYRETVVKSRRKIESQQRSLESLSAANESFVQHLPEMKEESAENERLRITRELHDSLGYSMTNIVMIMNAAQYLFEENPEKVRNYCLRTKEMASATMEETRQTLYKLRAIGRETPRNPSIFFDKLCRDFQEATGIETECHPGNLTRALPERIFNTLFRSVQVGFINALKHGKTGRIKLHFWINDENLRMTIWNSIEGLDFDADPIQEGIGLKGIRERLENFEGQLLMSRVVDGFNLTIMIPNKELSNGKNNGFDS